MGSWNRLLHLASLLLLLLLSGAATVVQAAPPSEANGDACSQADIVFVLDSSGSIKREHWGSVLSFFKFVVGQIPVGFYNTRFGSVTFGNEATIDFQLNTYNTTEDIVKAIDRIAYKDENTNTSGALWKMRSIMFTSLNGDRKNAPNIAIVITDGQSTYDHNLTLPYANEAKRAGITIIVIGVGDEIDPEELDGIASLNVNGTPIVYQVDNYDALYTIQREISSVACDIPVGELVVSSKIHCNFQDEFL